jgi:hypothetical protein
MNIEKVEKQIKEIEHQISIKCYNTKVIQVNSDICIALKYQHWLLSIEKKKLLSQK